MVRVTGADSNWSIGSLEVGTSGHGTLDIINGGSVSNTAGYVGKNASGVGQVTVDGAGSTWSTTGDLTIGNNSSTGNVSSVIVSRGGAVSAGGILLVEQSGAVKSYGNATIVASVINRGYVSPGVVTADPSMLVLPGRLHVDGSFLQSAAGTLTIHLGGATPVAQYDQLQVSGPVNLNGTLSVALVNSFVPSVGNAFDILDWATLSGTFSTIQLPSLAAGLTWNTSQLYTTGTLSVVSIGLPGDFNHNGVVDAVDYVVWRKGLGTTYSQSVYNIWRAHFGQTAGSGTSAIVNAVPEPAALVLLITGMLMICAGRRKPVS
jgi:T5SS/PEP-CTERM-associated repeat protein